MKSFKTKLILYFSMLMLFSSIVIGFISIRESNDALTVQSEKALSQLSLEDAKLAESQIHIQRRTLETIVLLDLLKSMNWEEQRPILQKQVEQSDFLDIGVLSLNGILRYSDGTSIELDRNDPARKALQGDKDVLHVTITPVTNAVVLMHAMPIEREGEVVGALLGRISSNTISDIIDNSGFHEDGYAFMIDENGTVIAHPDRIKVRNRYNPIEEAKEDESEIPMAALFEKILVEKNGSSHYALEGNEFYASYAPIKGSSWTLVLVANRDEVLSAIPPLQRLIFMVVVITLIIGIGIIYLVGNSIAKPIMKAIEHSKHIANLDVTKDVMKTDLKMKDEIGDLTKALQSITNNLRSVIREVSDSSKQVWNSSQKLNTKVRQSVAASEEVEKTVADMSKSVSGQVIRTTEGSSKAILLGKSIEKNLEYSKELNSASKKVSNIVIEGLEEMESLYRITEENNWASKEIYQVILKTNESANKIGKASNSIKSIAQKINLLALNAAIEAAKAGEAGNGFTVVAEEVQKLAEQSSNSSKTIDSVIIELGNNAQNAVKTMERIAVIVNTQTENVTHSKDRYRSIAEAMKNSERSVEHLNSSGVEMEIMKNEILQTLQNLMVAAEENSSAIKQVLKSMEKQIAFMEEIENTSDGLELLSGNLQSIIDKFVVE